MSSSLSGGPSGWDCARDDARSSTRLEIKRIHGALREAGHTEAADDLRFARELPSGKLIAEWGLDPSNRGQIQLRVGRKMAKELLDKEQIEELSNGRLIW